MFCHLMHLYANFQMGHLGTLEFNLQTFPNEIPTSPQICPLKPATLKTSQCTLHSLCSKIAPHTCSNSAFKKNPKQPIMHIKFALFVLLNILLQNQKIKPQTTPNSALTLPNSRCHENSYSKAQVIQ